jgi:hypothetical protein
MAKVILGAVAMVLGTALAFLNAYQTLTWLDGVLRRHHAALIADALTNRFVSVALMFGGLVLITDVWRKHLRTKQRVGRETVPGAHQELQPNLVSQRTFKWGRNSGSTHGVSDVYAPPWIARRTSDF